MPFPCDKCKRAGAICSGLEGERCGRCRAIRKPCSHNTQPQPSIFKSDPPGARFMSSLSVFTAEEDPVSLCAREIEGEAPSRLPEDSPSVSDKVTTKLKAGRAHGKSATPSGTSPQF